MEWAHHGPALKFSQQASLEAVCMANQSSDSLVGGGCYRGSNTLTKIITYILHVIMQTMCDRVKKV